MSPKHTPKTAASGGNQAFTFSAVFLCMSLLLVIIPSLRLVLLVLSGRVRGWSTVSDPLYVLKAHNKSHWNFSGLQWCCCFCLIVLGLRIIVIAVLGETMLKSQEGTLSAVGKVLT